jgi:predicted site-specific integrase-resolvase
MSKIGSSHLQRQAVVYLRQSTADQVQHNLESQRRQYALADRARALGWQEVAVIDDDLGRSGGGIHRPGFERMLAMLCEGNIGAVFCIEASRLARNGRDWHTLLEFCRLVDALIIDEDGIYATRRAWFKWLCRRSQRRRRTWERFRRLLERYPLPRPRITVRIWAH